MSLQTYRYCIIFPLSNQEQINTVKMDFMFFVNKNKEKEVIKAKEREEKAKLKDVSITETAETNVRKQQWNRELDAKALARDTKANLKDVQISETAETNVRKEQWNRELDAKALARDTKANLKDVQITETAETNVRKEQWNRELDAKALARDTKANLKDVQINETAESEIRKQQHEQVSLDRRRTRGCAKAKRSVPSIRICIISHFFLFLSLSLLQAKSWVATGRDTKANLKDVNMATAAIETEIRKEHHDRVSLIMFYYAVALNLFEHF